MTNDTTLLKYSLKTNTAKSLYFDIISKLSHYYYAFGRTTAWPTVTTVNPSTNVTTIVSDDTNPPSVSDAYTYELDTRRNIQYFKLVNPQDVCLLVSRYDWQQGGVYDQYDEYSETKVSPNGASTLATAKFYVLTDEMNVYKCLYNNKNGASSIKPTGTSPYSFMTPDGYIWKFMYSIPVSLRNRFLLTNFMPISNAMSDQFYSNGAIKNYKITNRGNGYISNTWRVKSIRIITGGSGYTTGGTVLEFSPASTGGTTALATVSSVGSSGEITGVTLTNQGAGYRIQPTLTILSAPLSAQGATFFVEYEKTNTDGTTEIIITGDGFNEYNPYSVKTVTLSKIVDTITLDNPGTLYSNTDTPTVTFTAPQLVGGVTATGTVTSTVDGSSRTITGITIVNAGSGYTSAPTITISAPANSSGIRATAIANMTDNRGSFAEVPTGSLFAYPAVKVGYGELLNIDVTFKSKAGGGYEIDAVNLISGGFGYDVPLVFGSNVSSTALSNGGVVLNLNTATQKNHAKAIPIIDSISGEITAMQITEPGIGYTYANIDVVGSMRFYEASDTVQVMSADPSNTYFVAGKVVSVMVTNAGSGYATVPTITFSAPTSINGVRATGTAIMSGAAVTGTTVTSGGSGYTTASVAFSAPQKAGGVTATGTVTLTGTEVTAIVLTNPGSGYTSAPSVTITGDGINAAVTATIGGNTLTGITITNRGSGYTSTPSVTVSAPVSGTTATARCNIFTEADIIVGFGSGLVDSKQSDVELLAVDGSIEVIEVDQGGLGFTTASELTVIGDGVGCKCTPVIANGQLSKVIVTDPGRGYTFASVTATGGGSQAVIRPIISPRGGHGKDAIEELYASTIMLSSRLVKEKNQGVDITNDFRQITIVKDIEKFGSESYYTASTGSACAVLKFDKTSANNTILALIDKDDALTLALDSNKYVTVLEKVVGVDYFLLLVSLDTNYLPVAGDTVRRVINSVTYDIVINVVTKPTINKYSGQLLYIDNRTPFVSSDEQTVAVNTLITL